MNKNLTSYHNYSWIILAMGTLVVFGALGLGRFGYSMVLPEMQSVLNLDHTQAGTLATSNMVGYLAAALGGGFLAARWGIRIVSSLGLFAAGASMLFTGLADSFLLLAAWRGLTGLGSGAANVAIMGIWAAWFSSQKRGLASGIAVAGSSIGLIFTGLLVPWLIGEYSDYAWRVSWYIFGALALALALCAYLVLRNDPSELGISEVNKFKKAEKQPEKETEKADQGIREGEQPSWKQVYLSAPVWFLGLIYIAFGFSYVIYMTFFVTFLVGEHHYSSSEAGNLFMAMGWLSLLCGIIWGSLSDKVGRKNTLIILFLIHATAFSLFSFGTAPVHFTVSAILFGLTAWSIPGIIAAACGDMLGAKFAPAALGFVTLFFGLGQATGPWLAGIIADATASFSPAFLLAAAVSVLGAGATALLLTDKYQLKSSN